MIWLAIALLPFVLYLPVYNGEYVFDDWFILYEPSLSYLRLGSIAEWRRFHKAFVGFRQLTWLTFFVNRLMCPGEWKDVKDGRFRLVCHLTNIVLHSVNSLLVGAIGGKFAALIFALHPLASSSVAYLSARPSILSSTFALAAVTLSLQGHPIIAALFIPLAMLSKEDMAILPVLLSVLEPKFAVLYLMPVCIFSFLKRREIRLLLKPAETGTAGWEDNGVQSLHGYDFHIAAFMEHALRLPMWCFGVCLNPDPEVGDLPWYVALSPFLWGIAVVTHQWLALALVVLSPLALYLIVETPDVVFEYRAYFAVAGMSVLLAQFPHLWFIAVLFAASTVMRAWYWSTRIGYWSWITRLSPTKVRGWSQLGLAFYEGKSNFHAERAYQEGMRANPNCALFYQHMAQVREAEGKFNEAAGFLEDGLKHCPRSLPCLYSLGIIRLKLGFPQTAYQLFQKAVELNPRHAPSHFQMGKLLMDDPKKALPYLRKAAECQPERDEFQQILAVVAFNAGEDPGPGCPYRVQRIPVEPQPQC